MDTISSLSPVALATSFFLVSLSSICILLTPKCVSPVLTSLLNSRLLYPMFYLISLGFPKAIRNLHPKKLPALLLQNLLLLWFSYLTNSNAMFSVAKTHFAIILYSHISIHNLCAICQQIFSVRPSKRVQNLNTSHHPYYHHLGPSLSSLTGRAQWPPNCPACLLSHSYNKILMH